MFEFMSEEEKIFWDKADVLIGGIDPLVRVILSANRFSQFGSFKNVIVTDELLDEITNRIRSLISTSKYFNVAKELIEGNPSEFILFAGTKANIKNVFTGLNKVELSEFDQIQKMEIIYIDESSQKQKSASKRTSSLPDEASSSKIIRLDDDAHLSVLKQKVYELISIANPLIDIEQLNLPFVLHKSTDLSISYKVPCFICNNQLSVSALVTPAGHLKYRIDNLSGHLENGKAHPAEAARIKEKKELLGCEENDFIEEIKRKLKTHPRLAHEITVLLRSYESPEKSDMFYKYLHESSLTFQRGSTSNNFNDNLKPLKDFCIYTYLKGGFGLYDSLYMNAPMPSTSLIKKNIQSDRMEPCKIYAKELKEFLDKFGLPYHVIVAEDATRILSRTELDTQTNELFGLLPPMDDTTGMPAANFFKLSRPSSMEHFVRNFEHAPYIQIIVAKPLKLDSPSMVIGAFPTNNAYNCLNVENRWKFIAMELEKYGISCGFSSDGDPRLLAGMKLLTNFGTLYYIRDLNVKLSCDMKSNNMCIQDPIHLTNKLKNYFFDTANDIELGGFLATINHVRIMVDSPNVPKDQHQINSSDINTNDSTRDKMNAESTRKICTPNVIKLIRDNVIHSEGTVAYLQIIRSIYDAFIELNIDPIDRLFHAYYAVSFIRIWRNNISTINNNFITSNVWTSIEMNFAFLLHLVINGNGHLIVVSNSQCCEELFRTLRSLSTFGLTEINFSLLECLEKINRVRKIQEISFDLKDIFVLRENLQCKSDKSHQQHVPQALPSIDICKRVLKEAFDRAKKVCQQLKMKNLNPCNPTQYLKSADKPTSSQACTSMMDNYDEDILNIKNTFILNEESDSQFYKVVTENGEFLRKVKKSYVLWLLQDEKSKLSNDRMVRFREGRKQKTVERVQSESSFYANTSIIPGDFLCMTTDEKGVRVVGQAVKFKYADSSSKKAMRYPFRNIIIGVNQNVLIRLLPCYFLSNRGIMSECSIVNFDISSYVCSIKPNVFDFENNRILPSYMRMFKRNFPTIF